jgi:hypothetical protein
MAVKRKLENDKQMDWRALVGLAFLEAVTDSRTDVSKGYHTVQSHRKIK